MQSLEWNDEAEEQGGAESPAVAGDDISAQNSEKEDNIAPVVEENEWDKLLRVRLGTSSIALHVDSVICL